MESNPSIGRITGQSDPDNLGYGELGVVYEGGATRGAPTPRIDKLAAEGRVPFDPADRVANMGGNYGTRPCLMMTRTQWAAAHKL